MSLEGKILSGIASAFKEQFGEEVAVEDLALQPTRKDFEGSHTFVTFPYGRISKKSPEETGKLIGEYLKQKEVVGDYNVVQGFLNLSVKETTWLNVFDEIVKDTNYGLNSDHDATIMVEFSSPNTNKPLHLGHLRNNFLGWSVSEILKANGNNVIKANLINDRGIHICKSMLAYQKFGNGETPESAGIKGDHLIGKYYVKFDQEYKEQFKQTLLEFYGFVKNEITEEFLKSIVENIKKVLPANEGELEGDLKETILSYLKDYIEGRNKIDFDALFKLLKNFFYQNTSSHERQIILNLIKAIEDDNIPIMAEARKMLKKWEEGDKEVRALWKQMNEWVYAGFEETYKNTGIDFDKYYYESDTYLLGKDLVDEGLSKNIFFKKDDGSVWIDLANEGLDEKLVLRGDGTSVYMTQDMGTAELKYKDSKLDKSVYVVGNEQDYHFKVLQIILKKLGKSYADGIYHLSYGMVDLPSGKMKSREGTVVDADDLLNQMIDTAREKTSELGKIDDFTEEQAEELYKMLALGALKYFLLKVDPKKRMLFNPEESIEFQGNTGPFIQYTHARISAILRKAEQLEVDYKAVDVTKLTALHPSEQQAIIQLHDFPAKVKEAGDEYAPSVIANYAFDLAKDYNHFYAEVPIFNEDDPEALKFRIAFSAVVARTLRTAMGLLGIDMPERM